MDLTNNKQNIGDIMGDNNQNYQAGRDVIVTGVSYIEAKDIASDVVNKEKAVIINRLEAEEEASRRAESFLNSLNDRITKIEESKLSSFKDPDVQFVISEATEAAVRTDSDEYRELLVDLIEKRVVDDGECIRKFSYNQAIKVINKLSKDQLNILTLTFLIKYTQDDSIVDKTTFLTTLLENRYGLFMNFRLNYIDIEHLLCCNCIIISTGYDDLLRLLGGSYPAIFNDFISEDSIKCLDLSQDIVETIFLKYKHSKNEVIKTYKFKFINEKILTKKLFELEISSEKQEKLLNLYNENILIKYNNENTVVGENNEFKEFLMSNSIGKNLLQIYKDSNINHISLTTIGKIIAITYYEHVTKSKLDSSIWVQ